jgi:hypothetical protein
MSDERGEHNERNVFEEDREVLREVREVKALVLGVRGLVLTALKQLQQVNAVLGAQQLILAKLKQIQALEQEILTDVTPPSAVTLSFEFLSSQLKGETNMPLSMPQNTTGEKYFIIGADASGLTGAQLAPGQTISVVSADPNTVAITPDAMPGVDNEGVQSVASGGVAAGPSPVLNSPINVTATVSNADGSVAESVVDTVTITAAVPGVAVSIGELFEQLVAGVPAAAARKR